MSATRRRKAYRAKPVYANAMARAMEAAGRLPEPGPKLIPALEALANWDGPGHLRLKRWRRLADAMNVAEALAELGIASDADSRACIARGHAALVALHERLLPLMEVDERLALQDALWLHGVQLQLCSVSELERAVARVAQRLQQALRGNAAPGVRVLEAG